MTHTNKATSFKNTLQVNFKDQTFKIHKFGEVMHPISRSNGKILGLDIGKVLTE